MKRRSALGRASTTTIVRAEETATGSSRNKAVGQQDCSVAKPCPSMGYDDAHTGAALIHIENFVPPFP
jgi:hypothetical protein